MQNGAENQFKTKAFIAKNALDMKKQSNQPRVISTRQCIMITWWRALVVASAEHDFNGTKAYKYSAQYRIIYFFFFLLLFLTTELKQLDS